MQAQSLTSQNRIDRPRSRRRIEGKADILDRIQSTSVVNCQFADLFTEVQRPIQISIDSIIVYTAYCDQIELVLVANQKRIYCYLLQIEESIIALYLPIFVCLHFTEGSNLCLFLTVLDNADIFAGYIFPRFYE